MSNVFLTSPAAESPPAGKPGYKPIDATTPSGAARQRELDRREQTRRKLEQLRACYSQRLGRILK